MIGVQRLRRFQFEQYAILNNQIGQVIAYDRVPVTHLQRRFLDTGVPLRSQF